jgi:hypothetical protein
MRQFTIAAATVAIAALISAPATAERINGGPIKQNGQCWQNQKGSETGTFGYWKACPQPASAPAVQKPARRRV